MNLTSLIDASFTDSIQTKQAALPLLREPIVAATEAMIAALQTDRKILACGNGGSASDALHFSAELINRFEIDRRALPAIALPADIAALTAIGNDASYDAVFSRQIEALGRKGDVLLAISTSGNSRNVVEAVSTAHEIGMTVIALTGRSGGELVKRLAAADIAITVSASVTARIQEVHLLVIHCLCLGIETALFGEH